MAKPFVITRTDGRSNTQVVIDLVKAGEPGTVYTYDEFKTALEQGAVRSYTRVMVQAAVRDALARLLKEHQRALACVAGIGYKLAAAREHVGLALTRRRRADVQLRCGLRVLRNVRWNELDENARKAHEGVLMVTSAIYAQTSALERRQSAVERALHVLKEKVDGLTTP